MRHSRNSSASEERRRPRLAPSTHVGERTRSAIADAAVEEFFQQGYIAARVESITARAGVGYGTFYRYFKSKVDVVQFLVEQAYGQLYAPVGRDPDPDAPVLERIYGNIIEFLRAYAANRKVLMVVEDAAGSDPEVANRIHGLQRAHAKRYAEKMAWPGYHPIASRELIAHICVTMGYAVARSWARSNDPTLDDTDTSLAEMARVLTLMTVVAVDPEALHVPADVLRGAHQLGSPWAPIRV